MGLYRNISVYLIGWNQMIKKKVIFGSYLAITDTVSVALVTTVVTKSNIFTKLIQAMV
jgi:hypothetical protein